MQEVALTYMDLVKLLNNLTPEQLRQNVTIVDIWTKEVHPIAKLEILSENSTTCPELVDSVLDSGHVVLTHV